MKAYARAALVGLLLSALVWAVLAFVLRAKEGAALDHAAQRALVHRLLEARWKEAQVLPLDPGSEPKAPTIVVVTGKGGARRPAPPIVIRRESEDPAETAETPQPPGGISGVNWWLAPVGWPCPDDLLVTCRTELKTAAGRVFGRVLGDACVNLPGGGQVCRGEEALEAVQVQVAPEVGQVAAPTPWALEGRAMAMAPSPGFLLGVSAYRQSRWGWALDAGVQNVDGRTVPVVTFGLAVRFGRGSTAR